MELNEEMNISYDAFFKCQMTQHQMYETKSQKQKLSQTMDPVMHLEMGPLKE